ncbi:sulfite exporter TauE/SafE family protein [Parvibacter caecicola]|uniref:sulfite exporter TauE/SafE family protein n=1 Tax=Parvibacter caecicola TaxID=747645 RepID=UPI00248BDE01|nr:sulfite exporter TauE/SafE family protein [Parvibacter caecicola]
MMGLIAASLAVGLLVGLLSGLLGVGGGTLFVPLFKLAYGLPAIACTATSMLAIVFTSVSGAVSHLRNRTCVPWLGLAAGLGGALTSPVGVYLATLSPEWAIMVAAAAIIAYSAITMVRKGLALPPMEKGLLKRRMREFWKSRKGSVGAAASDAGAASRAAAAVTISAGEEAAGTDAAAAPAAASPSPAAAPMHAASASASPSSAPAPSAPAADSLTQSDFAPNFPLVAKGALIGLCAGVMSGYVGVGGGFIMVPMMLQILKAPMRLVSGTSLIAVFILALPSVVYQALLGNVAWVAGISLAVGSMPGAVIGAKVLPWMPERALRLMFGGFLLVVAALMVVNQLGVWG